MIDETGRENEQSAAGVNNTMDFELIDMTADLDVIEAGDWEGSAWGKTSNAAVKVRGWNSSDVKAISIARENELEEVLAEQFDMYADTHGENGFKKNSDDHKDFEKKFNEETLNQKTYAALLDIRGFVYGGRPVQMTAKLKKAFIFDPRFETMRAAIIYCVNQLENRRAKDISDLFDELGKQ